MIGTIIQFYMIGHFRIIRRRILQLSENNLHQCQSYPALNRTGDTAGRVYIYVDGKRKETVSLIFAGTVSAQKPKFNIFKLFAGR